MVKYRLLTAQDLLILPSLCAGHVPGKCLGTPFDAWQSALGVFGWLCIILGLALGNSKFKHWGLQNRQSKCAQDQK